MSEFYSEVSTKECYKPYIQKFWILNNLQHPFSTPASYTLPNGCCTIVFVSGNGIWLNLASKTIELPAGTYLSGQISKRASMILKPYSKAIMAQIKPWLPPVITNISMHELVNDIVSLEYLNQFIHQQFLGIDLRNDAAVIQALYKAMDAYMYVDVDSRFIQWLYKRLCSGKLVQANISDIAFASGYSQRRVEQKFKTLVGLTAKEIQSILQLRKLIDDLSNPNDNCHLGTLALRHGYYDQSHFIRSYKRIISEAPAQFKVSEYILPLTGHFDFLQL
ncbi:helix-turn-helix domain-containing protein [Sphingobacterium sp. SRCM116780]|uniref:helix-turn-helix domain-containing protein n=1 Tax=Sphingobacterium sp. SRCM116780 TaxID=2907623 RepID=UPI001F26506E|nr:helix-turn-helix domain-containing protein [Sphingobacterium sp. SRCM116780]UIR57452.1 helix-turn-helix domain-containing protein [Sphingobacterium sp. SRCM116780]